ncbi:MAG: hypothetical protein F4X16_10990 [Caldilineaceae bacterium SB0661_bin_34]|nr:hypothetical protein [Caldilineaceae bacterium SB0661_bin_34]
MDTGAKEQYARHSGHLRCGGHNLPGTRNVAQIAAGFGLDNPSGRDQRRRGVIIAGRRAQLHEHAFTYGAWRRCRRVSAVPPSAYDIRDA